jgi:thiol-disulfide isomerase/thioredoxin
VIDTRRYQWIVGGIGLVLIVAFSVYLYVHGGGHNHPGVSKGQTLRHFVAPLATSDLNAPANVAPRCDPARPARRGLNVCGREPIVLEFFALDASPCIRAVSVLQQVAKQFPGVEFAAVAAGGSQHGTLALVRSHQWRIPIAYDSTAAVAQLYDVAVCPLIEVAGRGGVVQRLLIGERWEHAPALTGALRRVLLSDG